VKGFGFHQPAIIIGTLASTLNYPDYFPIIYRDRSQGLVDFWKDDLIVHWTASLSIGLRIRVMGSRALASGAKRDRRNVFTPWL